MGLCACSGISRLCQWCISTLNPEREAASRASKAAKLLPCGMGSFLHAVHTAYYTHAQVKEPIAI